MGDKRKNRLRQGVGINDADYNTGDCPYMRRWSAMLQRCYSESYHKRKPSYRGCYVCKEWLIFSNFKSWMEKQDWKDKQLDKDFLGDGKLYSPETCCFVSKEVNAFLTLKSKDRGIPIGVTKASKGDSYEAQFSDGSGGHASAGFFKDKLKAHREWQKYKISIIKNLLLDYENSCISKELSDIKRMLEDHLKIGKETTYKDFLDKVWRKNNGKS